MINLDPIRHFISYTLEALVGASHNHMFGMRYCQTESSLHCSLWHAFCTFIQDMRGITKINEASTKTAGMRLKSERFRENVSIKDAQYETLSNQV